MQASLDELARAWLEAAATSQDVRIANEAAKQQSQLATAQPDGAQGLMGVARSAVAAVAKVPIFGNDETSFSDEVMELFASLSDRDAGGLD